MLEEGGSGGVSGMSSMIRFLCPMEMFLSSYWRRSSSVDMSKLCEDRLDFCRVMVHINGFFSDEDPPIEWTGGIGSKSHFAFRFKEEWYAGCIV